MRALLTTVAISAMACMGMAHAEGPLESQLVAYAITVNDDGKEVRQEATDVAPGQTIEYTMVYSNVGNESLSGLTVSAPIPAATTFKPDSNNTAVPSTFEVKAAGLDWGTPPLTRLNASGEMETVPASEYKEVRWKPQSAMPAGRTYEFHYRVEVE